MHKQAKEGNLGKDFQEPPGKLLRDAWGVIVTITLVGILSLSWASHEWSNLDVVSSKYLHSPQGWFNFQTFTEERLDSDG